MSDTVLNLLADAVLVVHFAFILSVVLGGLLVLRWPRLAWAHVPIFAWGAFISFVGWICPLTPLENWLRRQAGGETYSGGFIETYLTAAIYPEGLTRGTQIAIGVGVLLLNGSVYLLLLRRVLRARR